jgi:hypothetical protein
LRSIEIRHFRLDGIAVVSSHSVSKYPDLPVFFREADPIVSFIMIGS